jgi:hypothetical protein
MKSGNVAGSNICDKGYLPRIKFKSCNKNKKTVELKVAIDFVRHLRYTCEKMVKMLVYQSNAN